MSRWWGPVIGLIALGWAFWVVGVVFLVFCEGLESNPGIAAPGDPCRDLRWLVIGGFVFLFVASILTPLAVAGRWRQVTMPAARMNWPLRELATSVAVRMLRFFNRSRSKASGWRRSVSPRRR